MKAWLKGGLIGVLFIVVIIIFENLKSQFICFDYCGPSVLSWFFLPLVLIGNLLFLLLIYFIIGAVIGLVIEKFKSKKQVEVRK
ncbi:hypothetical protein HOD75_04900 [archaeon]|jgi:hypothetical protein|nr:hypothetical protein [archaeon]MBT4242203.1 hypothetical protein [archaeon]MBT4417891.1 hypothetical protein [archaeon]